jgi:uncharacterized membrane protein YgcG
MQTIQVYKHLVILWLCLFTIITQAQNAYIPEPTGKVISDFQGLLSENEQEVLATEIKNFYLSSSNQLIIVSIPTKYLGGLTIEDYSNQLFKKWQPGQKDLNNGLLFIIVGSKNDSVNRKVRIEVGYGLEGALPDLLTQRILKQLVVPSLKKQNYFKAIELGSKAILNAIKAENSGHQPIFKLKTNTSQTLIDKAGVLSTSEFISIKDDIENSAYNTTTSTIEATEEVQNAKVGYCFVEFYPSNSFHLTNALFNLYITPNISVDSLGVINRSQKPSYSISIFKHAQLSENDKRYYESKIKSHLSNNNVVDAIKDIIELSHKNIVNAWIKALLNMLLCSLPCLVISILYFKTKKVRKTANKDPYKYDTGIINLLATFVFFITGAMILLNLFLNIGLYYDHYELQLTYLIPLFIIHTPILIFGVVFANRLIQYYLPNYFNSSGSSDDDDNSDSSSTSTNSSSQSSSHSSSSNSDYGGGGGSSGGAGSSSDW